MNVFSVGTVSAAPALSLKWAVPTGAATYIGALAADLRSDIAGMEIVLTGVSRVASDFKNGSVVALNGNTGQIIWKSDASYLGNGIQDHSPFEIADLNGDGSLEIGVFDQIPSRFC